MTGSETISTYMEALSGYSVFLAHNANGDAIVSVDETLASTLGPPADASPTGSLGTRAELSRRIADAMERGDGDLVAMTDEFGEWLTENLEPEETRLGGQAAIMSDLMSIVGASPVLYTYLLSERQRSLFTDPDSIRFPDVDDEELRIRPMSEVTNADRTKINWIFDFEDDVSFHDATAATDSRFIAAARPDRVNLETGLEPVAGQLAGEVECALLSGYHSLKTEYADGSTYEDRIEQGREMIHRLKREDGLPVQVEYGVTHKTRLREAIARRIVPEVDAIGMDDRELDLLVSDLGLGEGDEEGSVDGAGGDGIVETYELIERVREELGIECVKLHRKNYHLTVSGGDYLPPEAMRRGWAFAAIIAAAKGRKGTIDEPADLEAGLEVDYADAGHEAVATLAEHVGAPVENDALATPEVVAHPNRVVEDPDGTVGLGDSISVANFAVEQALAKRTEQSVTT